MKYIVAGLAITNSIAYADGRVVRDILGGSVYALSGIKLYTDDVLFVSNVGEDYADIYGDYMGGNQLSWKGIQVVTEHTSYDHLTYTPDGRWERASIYGELQGLQLFGIHRPRPEDVEPHLDHNTKGIYNALGIDRVIWNRWAQLRKKYGYRFVWELLTADCTAKNKERILSLLPDADVWSMNLPEAMAIFSVSTEEAVVEQLKKIPTPCFFRVGEKGAYYIAGGKATFVPSLRWEGPDPDPTGCGNTSTAACIYAVAEGYSPAMIAALCNVAAYYNVRQLGPIQNIDGNMRADAFEKAKRLAANATEL